MNPSRKTECDEGSALRPRGSYSLGGKEKRSLYRGRIRLKERRVPINLEMGPQGGKKVFYSDFNLAQEEKGRKKGG